MPLLHTVTNHTDIHISHVWWSIFPCWVNYDAAFTNFLLFHSIKHYTIEALSEHPKLYITLYRQTELLVWLEFITHVLLCKTEYKTVWHINVSCILLSTVFLEFHNLEYLMRINFIHGSNRNKWHGASHDNTYLYKTC